jgi:hypothetical protein
MIFYLLIVMGYLLKIQMFFSNIVKNIGEYNFPISVKYFHQYSTGHGSNEPIFYTRWWL